MLLCLLKQKRLVIFKFKPGKNVKMSALRQHLPPNYCHLNTFAGPNFVTFQLVNCPAVVFVTATHFYPCPFFARMDRAYSGGAYIPVL
jgi:hypothetical protein